MTINATTAARPSMRLEALDRSLASRTLASRTLGPGATAGAAASLPTDTVSLRQAAPIAHVSLCEAEGVFDGQSQTWSPEAFPVSAAQTQRVIGLNQPGGPQVDPAALADPTAYTLAATERHRRNQPKDTGYVVGALVKPALNQILSKPKTGDAVPEMPSDLLSRIESHLQPGDILLQGANDDMRTGDRSLFIHGMLYLGRNREGRGYVVHAIAQTHKTPLGDLEGSVRLSDFQDAMQRDLPGTDRLAVLRPARMTQADYNRLVTFAVGEVGKPYDFAFDCQDDSRYYCTELVAKELACLDPAAAVTPDPGLPVPMITDRSIRQAQASGHLQHVLTLNPRPDRE